MKVRGLFLCLLPASVASVTDCGGAVSTGAQGGAGGARAVSVVDAESFSASDAAETVVDAAADAEPISASDAAETVVDAGSLDASDAAMGDGGSFACGNNFCLQGQSCVQPTCCLPGCVKPDPYCNNGVMYDCGPGSCLLLDTGLTVGCLPASPPYCGLQCT
jgi:hypothetical protein